MGYDPEDDIEYDVINHHATGLLFRCPDCDGWIDPDRDHDCPEHRWLRAE